MISCPKVLESIMVKPYQDLYIYYFKGHLESDINLSSIYYLGNWQEDEFSFLFFSISAENRIENLLKDQPQLDLLDSFHMSYDDWQGGALSPVRIGHFLITPPWIDCKCRSDEQKIMLDPGVVFGTGTHPTTRDCIKAIDLACRGKTGQFVLDIGTGTGLLALAAAKSGAKQVLAVDLNFLAAKTALENIRLNQLNEKIVVVQGDAEKFMDYPADLVITNIHFAVMEQLVKTKGFLNKKQFIISGLMRSQAHIIEKQLALLPITVIKRWDHNKAWYTCWGKIDHNNF